MHMNEIVGDEPTTILEKYFAKAPKALEILEREIAVRRREEAETTAHLAYKTELNAELRDVEIEAGQNERLTKPSDSVRARCDKAHAAVKAKIAKADASRKPYSDSAANHLEEFIGKLSPLNGSRPFRDYGYSAELPEGATLQHMATEVAPDRLAEARILVEVAKDSPATKELVGMQISDEVDALAVHIGLGNVKKPGGKINWPTKQIFAGLNFRDEIDAAGILCNVFSEEIKAALTKRALEDYDDSEAKTVAERREAIKQAKADLLEAERFAAYWRRQCIAAGIDPGKPIVSNPLAILDIVEA